MMDIAPLNGVDDRQSRSIYPTRESLSALAGRIRQRHAVRPRSSVGEHRMTTGEMLAEGLHLPDGAVNFAIGLPESLDLPVAWPCCRGWRMPPAPSQTTLAASS